MIASYASQVKKELASLEVNYEHAKSELAAFIRMSGSISLGHKRLQLNVITEHPATARRLFSLMKKVYNIESEIIVSRKMKLKKNNQYVVRIKERVSEILDDLKIMKPNSFDISTTIPQRVIDSQQDSICYLRGAFLTGGSINNPETSRYHLEIYSNHEDHNEAIAAIMNRFDLNAKTTQRRSGYITYLKGAEQIAEFLNITGATSAMLAFEDLRIMRDMRNSVNRLVNCDTANLKKTANAAARQVENISLIEQTYGLDVLPEKLQILASFRMKNQEMSLKELAAKIPDGPISKSGINHRFKKLNDVADKIRTE